MLVASFLTKTLHIDWRIGERFFAQHLVDYHPSANNGGWQWAAGTGTDAQPYFRTFSPWLQSAKHDPDALYIKKYIPELDNIPAKDIHKWNERYIKYPESKYPKPIVDHAIETKKTMQIYKAIN
jgi:deoxyribodipyrimidine photo-lyase